MAKPKYCKAVAEFMEMELERLTGRLVMVPRLTKEEVEGIVYGWRTLTDEFEEKCGCPRVKEVGDLVAERGRHAGRLLGPSGLHHARGALEVAGGDEGAEGEDPLVGGEWHG